MALSEKKLVRISKKYYRSIYELAFAKTRKKEDSLDIAQETFLVLLEKADELNEHNIGSWLCCVCLNKVKEYRRVIAAEEQYIERNEELENIPAPELSELMSEDVDLFNSIQKRILSLLTSDEQRVFVELFIEQKDISLFAEENNITLAAAKTRKSRLKKKAMNLYKAGRFLLLVLSFKYFF